MQLKLRQINIKLKLIKRIKKHKNLKDNWLKLKSKVRLSLEKGNDYKIWFRMLELSIKIKRRKFNLLNLI